MKNLWLTAIVMIAGCVTRGDMFSSDMKWIKIDKTSKVEVSKRLGEPFSIGSSSGTDTWTYGYYKHRLFGESEIKELKFYWNDDSTVKSYSFNSSFEEDKKLK